MNKLKTALVILLVIIIQSLPYFFAAAAGGSEHIFSGFLINPMDGNSYLAKMQEGWAGSWKFDLLYSSHGGSGAYLFLFYLFLGHLARIFSLPLIWVFHVVRVISSAAMMVALAQFFQSLFKNREDLAWKAFQLASLGAGLGWLAALSGGYLTGDFWIAEAFPFLSGYANPHFPLGLALILWVAVLDEKRPSRQLRFWQAVVGLLLSIIQPFGLVIAAIVLAGNLLAGWIVERKVNILSSLFTLSLGGPFLLYQYLAIQNDPVLALWNQQNQTPAPPVWDLVWSLSPAILLALAGTYCAWKEKNRPALQMVCWFIFSILLIYLPFNLQRRFMTGLYVPAAGLAVVGAAWLARSSKRGWRWLYPALIILSVPTNLLVLVSGAAGAAKLEPFVFTTRAEKEAFAWIQERTPQDALVLANAGPGLLVPAQTGRRVVYGHPFETIHADEEKAFVDDFYAGKLGSDDMKSALSKRGVDYVLFDTSDYPVLLLSPIPSWEKAYDRNGIQIYALSP